MTTTGVAEGTPGKHMAWRVRSVATLPYLVVYTYPVSVARLESGSRWRLTLDSSLAQFHVSENETLSVVSSGGVIIKT